MHSLSGDIVLEALTDPNIPFLEKENIEFVGAFHVFPIAPK